MNTKVSYGSLAPAMIGGLGVVVRTLINKATRSEPPVSLKRLSELIEFSDSGVWGDESLDQVVEPRVFRVSDFNGDFRLNYASAPARSIPDDKLRKFQLLDGDILVVKSSGSAKQVVSGRVAVFEAPNRQLYAASNFLLRLRPAMGVDPHYLAFILGSPPIREFIADSVKTMTYPNLSFRIYGQIEVPIIPLHDQRTVATFFQNLMEKRPLSELPYFLAEQGRIVARIEELAGDVAEANRLRQNAAEEAKLLISRTIAAVLDEGRWQTQLLGQLLVEPPRNGLSPQPEIDSGGRLMLRINAVSSSPTRFVDLNAFKRVEVSDEQAQPFLLENDDVFIVRYNGDINRLAKPAIYKGRNEGRILFPDKLMRLRPDRNKMLPDFLVFALKCRSVREQIEDIGKTTAGNIGISGANVKSFRVPVPPLPDQRRIVGELDALQRQVDSLQDLQAETSVELDALMPSILDKAFRGEL